MIRQLNRVDVEDNTVGWYQSAYFGTYIDENAITSQITYQSSISKSVVIFFGKQQQQKKRKKKERKRKKWKKKKKKGRRNSNKKKIKKQRPF